MPVGPTARTSARAPASRRSAGPGLALADEPERASAAARRRRAPRRPRRTARATVGRPRRRSSSSSAGRSSWTSENVCTQLEGERRRQRVLAVAAERLGRRQAEHRPQPLAARQQRVAHRLGERRRCPPARRRSSVGERLVDERAVARRARPDAVSPRPPSRSGPPLPLDLGRQLARELVELAQRARRPRRDRRRRLEPRARVVDAARAARPVRALLGAHRPTPRRARCAPSTPFTNVAASGEA